MKTGNEYSELFADLYARTPKAVFAAVAYSYCSAGGDADVDAATANFLNEWAALHSNGIVPQVPPIDMGAWERASEIKLKTLRPTKMLSTKPGWPR